MKPKLKFTCTEDWNKMKVGLISRHCDNCNKAVHDFTEMSREEIVTFLRGNQGKEVCGRFKSTQIDFHHKDPLIVIESLITTHRNSNLIFYLLTIGSLILISCEEKATQQDNSGQQTKEINSPITSIIQVDSSKILPPQHGNVYTIPPIEKIELSTFTDYELGFVVTDDFNSSDPLQAEPYDLVEVMPEYIDGIDSLVSFIKKNAIYPAREKRDSIEGTTFISIVIDTTGNITNPTIVRSSTDNFDKEALRLIKLLQAFTPGQHQGQKVPVRYVIPVKFAL